MKIVVGDLLVTYSREHESYLLSQLLLSRGRDRRMVDQPTPSCPFTLFRLPFRWESCSTSVSRPMDGVGPPDSFRRSFFIPESSLDFLTVPLLSPPIRVFPYIGPVSTSGSWSFRVEGQSQRSKHYSLSFL